MQSIEVISEKSIKKHILNNKHNKTTNNRQIIKTQKTHQSSYFVIKKMYKNTL